MKQFQHLIQEFSPDSELVSIQSLTGGISAQTTLLEVKHSDGRYKKYVVRQHGERDRASNPRIAFDEYKLLTHLHNANIPSAKPVHVSEDIFEHPCIVLEYIEGNTVFSQDDGDDFIRQMADALIRIHSIPDAKTTFDFLPAQALRYTHRLNNPPATIDESLNEGLIRDALKTVWLEPLPGAKIALEWLLLPQKSS